MIRMLAIILAVMMCPVRAQTVLTTPVANLVSFSSPSSLVASLPSCTVSNTNMIYTVTNALTPVIGSVVVGGGAISVLVHCQSGVGWVVG